MARGSLQSQQRHANLTPAQKRRAIELIQKRIGDIEAFNPETMDDQFDPPLKALNSRLEETLAQIYPSDTFEHARHAPSFRVDYGPLYMGGAAKSVWVSSIERNRVAAIGHLQALIESFGEQLESDINNSSATPEVARPPGKRVFIVHGREDGLKQAVARFLESAELEAVILHEQSHSGATIIEKLEVHGDCDFAVVLLTPDDEGRLVGKGELTLRARQNVIYELGFFAGRLGRRKVAALLAPGIEMPSDLHGVGFIPVDAGGSWQFLLARELRAAGLEFDLNKALRV